MPGTNPSSGTATYYYPMDQSARFVWYHDHAIGITRTNAYSGIASALVITDAFESYLLSQNLLPDLVGIPLVIQDKTFLDKSKDPSYPDHWGSRMATSGIRGSMRRILCPMEKAGGPTARICHLPAT